jgi:hypothetical protein
MVMVDGMEEMGDIKVLFIAGFGPIVRDASVSRKLYNRVLGIGFKEEDGDYLHTEALEGAKTFALWPLHKPHSHALARIPGPTKFLRPKPGSSLTLITSSRRLGSWNRKGIECS